MSIVYIISAMILFVLIMLIPKTKEKVNFIKVITITIICFLAYNTFICYLLNFLNIPITLLSLSIINFLISVILLYKIIKNKEIQKYKIEKRSIFISIILIIVVGICIIINFNNMSKIRYLCMDAVQHYKAAREFSENTTLFDKAIENTTTSKSHMPMGYVNVGIIFKVLMPFLGLVSLYKVYILFETVIYFLTGLMFYYLVEKICENKNQYIIAIIFSIIYLIAYPLNAFICGFHYLVIGILYFTTILYVMKELILLEKIKFSYSIIILLLLNIGLIFSYALFCPVIYLAEFIYFIYKYKKDKNKKHLIISILLTLILTGLMGCDIILYQRFKEIGATGIALEGWIYKNDWSNIILFIPFVIYYFIKLFKKENIFEKTILISFMVFHILLLIGKNIGICSNYYFYKNSYILWILILYMALKTMVIFIKNSNVIYKYIVNIFTTCYLFILIISLLSINTYITSEGKEDENLTTMMNIFTFNKTNMVLEASFLSKEELQAIKQYSKIIDNKWRQKEENLILPSSTQILWVKALTGYDEVDEKNISYYINKWNEGKYKYLMFFKERQPAKIAKQMLKLENTKVIYENNAAIIYLRNEV